MQTQMRKKLKPLGVLLFCGAALSNCATRVAVVKPALRVNSCVFSAKSKKFLCSDGINNWVLSLDLADNFVAYAPSDNALIIRSCFADDDQ